MLRNGLNKIILELVLMSRIELTFQAQISVTEISKLKDINPGDILKNFHFEETDTRIHKSRRKIKNKNHQLIRHACINCHQILKAVYI
jgi:hypothetical protein